MNCPFCKANIDPYAEFCNECGVAYIKPRTCSQCGNKFQEMSGYTGYFHCPKCQVDCRPVPQVGNVKGGRQPT